MKETGLTEIEIEHNGARIRVSRSSGSGRRRAGRRSTGARRGRPAARARLRGPAAGAVPSPMVGTVYLSPEPGKPAFIKVGQDASRKATPCSSWKR